MAESQLTWRGVALVGLMGVGKSTVGKLLAEMLEWEFVDLDSKIELRANQSISEIFQLAGEAGFRRLEFDALLAVTATCAKTPCVLATGGGIVTTEDARNVLTSAWSTVWLTCQTERIVERLQLETAHRPLLANAADLKSRIEELADRRKALYRSVAQWEVSVDDASALCTAREICRLGGWTNWNA